MRRPVLKNEKETGRHRMSGVSEEEPGDSQGVIFEKGGNHESRFKT